MKRLNCMKKIKISVDIHKTLWYSNMAVSENSKKQTATKKKIKKNQKKLLTSTKQCANLYWLSQSGRQ